MSFSLHWEKLSDILSYNENHKLGTTRKTIKKEEEEEEEKLLQEKTRGGFFNVEKSSLGWFLCNEGVGVKKISKNNSPNFF